MDQVFEVELRPGLEILLPGASIEPWLDLVNNHSQAEITRLGAFMMILRSGKKFRIEMDNG